MLSNQFCRPCCCKQWDSKGVHKSDGEAHILFSVPAESLPQPLVKDHPLSSSLSVAVTMFAYHSLTFLIQSKQRLAQKDGQ